MTTIFHFLDFLQWLCILEDLLQLLVAITVVTTYGAIHTIQVIKPWYLKDGNFYGFYHSHPVQPPVAKSLFKVESQQSEELYSNFQFKLFKYYIPSMYIYLNRKKENISKAKIFSSFEALVFVETHLRMCWLDKKD